MRSPGLGNQEFFTIAGASADALGFLLSSEGLLTTPDTGPLTD